MGGCLATSAFAQNTEKKTDLSIELNPVVVTGTGTHYRLKDTPTPVSVITANEIKKAGITDFRSAMTMLEPSLSFSTNAMGDYLMMNGLSNKYVLILINGRKLTGDSDRNIDLNRIDLNNVKRIEILKGAGSALYGSDAIGGVINIITNQPINLLTLTSHTKIEGHGQFTQNINADVTTKKFGSYTSYQRRQADGWQNSNQTEDKNGALVHTDKQISDAYYLDTYNQKFTFTPNKKFSAYIEGGMYDRKVKRPISEYTYNLTYDAFNLGAGARYNLNKRGYVQFDLRNDNYDTEYLYIQDVTDKTTKKTFKTGEQVRQKRQHYYDANLKTFFRLTDNSRTILGLQYLQETLERASFGVDERAYTMAAYAQEELTLMKNFNLVAGLRYTHHENAGNNLTPKLSLMYRMGDFTVRGQYSAGFRAPGLDELYKLSYSSRSTGASGTLSIGDKNLKAEKSNYGSVNLEYHNTWLNVGVTGFINRLSDMIVGRTQAYGELTATQQNEVKELLAKASPGTTPNNKMNVTRFLNAEKALIKGFEVNLNANLGYGFGLSGNYAYTHARNKDIETGWRLIDRAVRHTGSVTANYAHSWKDNRIDVSLNGRIQSKRTLLKLSKGAWEDNSAPGFAQWNFSTRYVYSGISWLSIEPGAGVNNLFDKKDERPYGANYFSITPGRTVYVSLLLRFKK